MTDIQAMLNVMSEMAEETRSKYHLTLGQLINRLEKMPKNRRLLTSDGRGIEGLGSYRGYYSDLALHPVDGPVWTAAQLHRACRGVLGAALTGYKGGEFLMEKNTPLWLASYGCLGPAIMDLTPDGILVTSNLDKQED
ncbi:MAG: hypothetical protein ACK5VI_03410 [Opitutia bacterium]|jgi:hypothetical protein